VIEVLVATVNAAALLAVALVANRTRQHAKAARAQVQNSHNTNLREELDERHNDNVHRFEALSRWQVEHERAARRRDHRITGLAGALAAVLVGGIAHLIRK
jgi:Flp pilus assembly protein TadB